MAAPESLKKCDCRRLGGGSDVKRKPHPYREIDFGFVPCVPCVRARRSCVGGREEILLWVGRGWTKKSSASRGPRNRAATS